MTPESEILRVIAVTEDRGNIVKDVDGFYKYWPKAGQGYILPHQMRLLADYIDAKNRDWEDQLRREMK